MTPRTAAEGPGNELSGTAEPAGAGPRPASVTEPAPDRSLLNRLLVEFEPPEPDPPIDFSGLPVKPGPVFRGTGSRRLAAFRLGYLPFEIALWFDWLADTANPVRLQEHVEQNLAGLRLSVREYGDILDILNADLSPPTRSDLVAAAGRVHEFLLAVEAGLAQAVPQWPAWNLDPIEGLTRLGSAAVDPATGVGVWYQLGRAFGEWELSADRFRGFGDIDDRSPVQFRHVTRAATRVPDSDRARCPVLEVLNAADSAGERRGDVGVRDCTIQLLRERAPVASMHYRLRGALVTEAECVEDTWFAFSEAVPKIRDQVEAYLAGSVTPVWNGSSGSLSLGGQVLLKLIPGRAREMVKILDAFHAGAWCDTVASPWPDEQEKTRTTCRDLSQKAGGRIQFKKSSVGSSSICWELPPA